jgi:hypothetical protein
LHGYTDARLRLRFPLVALFAFPAGCQGNPNLISYGVYGYVKDAASGHALSGIEVEFTSDTLRHGSDETDSNGRYEIVVESDTAFGHLTVTDPRGRYAAKTVEVYFDEDTRRVDVGLGPAPPAE